MSSREYKNANENSNLLSCCQSKQGYDRIDGDVEEGKSSFKKFPFLFMFLFF